MLFFLRLPLSRVSGALMPAHSPTSSHVHLAIACSCLKKTLKNKSNACYASYIVLSKRGNLIYITVTQLQYQMSYEVSRRKYSSFFVCQAVH